MCQQTGVRSDLNQTLSWCRSEFLSPAGVGETCLQQQVRGGGWQGHFLYDLSRQLLAGGDWPLVNGPVVGKYELCFGMFTALQEQFHGC